MYVVSRISLHRALCISAVSAEIIALAAVSLALSTGLIGYAMRDGINFFRSQCSPDCGVFSAGFADIEAMQDAVKNWKNSLCLNKTVLVTALSMDGQLKIYRKK